MRRIAFGTALLGAVLIASIACGGGDENSSSDDTPTGRATSAATATPPAVATQTAAASAPTAEATLPPAPPTAAPPVPTVGAATPTAGPPPPPPPPPPPSGQAVTLVAKDTKFSGGGIKLTVGTTISLTLDNQDEALAHDVVVYAPSGVEVARTDIIVGPASATTSFAASVPGTYAYKCSVHPLLMTGGFSAQ